ncbi:MAG: hypothetical protein E7282_03730 [Lachnospiraceae bacterium]|nr:hypothetical protein [Lachnospiraceae bacterium]
MNVKQKRILIISVLIMYILFEIWLSIDYKSNPQKKVWELNNSSDSYPTSSYSYRGEKSTGYTGQSNSNKALKSRTQNYDDGYNDVYEEDDYDQERYETDDDYASGVDDAMEDVGGW